jgi:hypothetical protein
MAKTLARFARSSPPAFGHNEMAKRDPEKTARNKLIAQMSAELKQRLPQVLTDTGIHSELSLHAQYGSKHADYIDMKYEVITSPDHFVSLYLAGFRDYVEAAPAHSAHRQNFDLLRSTPSLKEYLYIFLKRTYLRNFEALSKRRPKTEDAELWIGQQNASYGIMITPRFNRHKRQWENDKSEIRHFTKRYWSIGHVLETGLCVPSVNAQMQFATVDDYLNFFLNVLVRNSGSAHEYKLASQYADYVRSSTNPEAVPLLIPELRYGGLSHQHQYRLDFCLIKPSEFNRIGIELSPWSTHGHLAKLKGLTQAKINEMARDNFEKEMRKHKDFFRKYGIFVLIYTDSDLADMERVFADLRRFLERKEAPRQLRFHIIDELLG